MADATSSPSPMPPAVPIGAHVTSRGNPGWGKGIVMGRDGKLVRVLFMNHPSRKQVAVPAASVVVEHVADWPDPSRVTPTATSAPKAKAKPPRKLAPPDRTREEGMQYFLKKFPGTFSDPGYLAEERNHKWEAHQLFERMLGATEITRLVQAGDANELVLRAKHVESSTNLLFRIEKARFHAAFDQPDRTLTFFDALAHLLEATERSAAFERYVKALEALPCPGGRLASWAVSTVLPYLARPDAFMFVKPRPTKEMAARYELDLRYSPSPNWATYGQVMKLVQLLREDLDPLGCRDLIDVQSFIWVTA